METCYYTLYVRYTTSTIIRESPAFLVFTQSLYFNTMRTGDADLRFYISTVQDG